MKEQTDNRLRNFLSFYLIISGSDSSFILGQSPDYIFEKLNSIIGFEIENPIKYDSEKNTVLIDKYFDRWLRNKDERKKYENMGIINILMFFDYFENSIDYLILNFEKYIGGVYKISKDDKSGMVHYTIYNDFLLNVNESRLWKLSILKEETTND